MNQSNKLSLFLSLGCKPMKDVILKCNNRMWVGALSIDRVEELMRGIKCVYIEAIPERVCVEQVRANMNNINHWKEYGGM